MMKNMWAAATELGIPRPSFYRYMHEGQLPTPTVPYGKRKFYDAKGYAKLRAKVDQLRADGLMRPRKIAVKA